MSQRKPWERAKENQKMMSKKLGYQQRKIIKRNQTKILELENTITEVRTHRRGSTADLSRKKKGPVNSKDKTGEII